MQFGIPLPHSGKKPTGGSWGMFHTNLWVLFFCFILMFFCSQLKKKILLWSFWFHHGDFFGGEGWCQASPFTIQLVEETSCFSRQRKKKLCVHLLLLSIMRSLISWLPRRNVWEPPGNRVCSGPWSWRQKQADQTRLMGWWVKKGGGKWEMGPHSFVWQLTGRLLMGWERVFIQETKGKRKWWASLSWNAAHFQQVFSYSSFCFLLLRLEIQVLGPSLYFCLTNEFQWTSQMAEWWRICLPSRRYGFDPWVRKIPWRRKWQRILVFLPGKSHGQRALVGYSPWGRKELDTA